MQEIHTPAHAGALSGAVLTDWRPEDRAFWEGGGRAIARRNLWLSIPALLLSFAVWQVWSVVVAKLPSVGFQFTTDQLFWLAALPGISGAVLRIFYSFMVPIFGGRLWTTLATWSLMIPAVGIGYAVQNPTTPYFVFLALRCCAASAAATSPRRWRTSRSSSRAPRRATRSRSMRGSAISASASCSSWCRSRSPSACSAGSAAIPPW